VNDTIAGVLKSISIYDLAEREPHAHRAAGPPAQALVTIGL
jgi:hypothetical protein